MTDEFAAKRQAMVNEQLARRGIDDQRVLDAISAIKYVEVGTAESLLHIGAPEDLSFSCPGLPERDDIG